MDDPNVLTTHNPVWDRMLPRTGRCLPFIQPSLSKDIEEICHSLFKLWFGTADPGAGLFIFPFGSISVHLRCAASLPLLMLQWLLMALLQSYPSTRNMPCPQNLETPGCFLFLFFFRMLKCMHSYELFSIQCHSFLSCYLHWSWGYLHCPVLFECVSCPA